MEDTTQNTVKPYAVVVVFSRWQLRKLCSYLEDELGATKEHIGVMRIDRSKGQETNRTVMLLDRGVLDEAKRKGLTEQQKGLDFRMVEYEIREHDKPEEGYTRNLYIPLPEDLSSGYAQFQLENKLNVLCKFGMFAKSAPRVKIPLTSRESEAHRGRAFVTFSRDTDDDEAVLARVLLKQTRLYLDDEESFKLMLCFWAKEREQRDDKTEGADGAKIKKAPGVKGAKNGARGPKNPRKKVPQKGKGPQKDTGDAVPPKPVLVAAEIPAESKWNKPLVAPVVAPLVALPPLVPVQTAQVSEQVAEQAVSEDVIKGTDFPPLSN